MRRGQLQDAVYVKPLPTSQIGAVILIQMCEAININVLFPFLAFMVEDLGYTGNKLGYYAGGLAASFCLAQFSSSILWGIFSDRYGRKPAIVVGMLGAALGMLIFGLADSYPQAVAGRMISGLLSGNLGVMKSFLTEITDDSNRSLGFSYISVAWAAGTIIAPLAGGLLCKPAQKYPGSFSAHGTFGKYPYLLPCLLCVIFNVVTSLLCVVVMRESRHPVAPGESSVKEPSRKLNPEIGAIELTTSGMIMADHDEKVDDDRSDIGYNHTLTASTSSSQSIVSHNDRHTTHFHNSRKTSSTALTTSEDNQLNYRQDLGAGSGSGEESKDSYHTGTGNGTHIIGASSNVQSGSYTQRAAAGSLATPSSVLLQGDARCAVTYTEDIETPTGVTVTAAQTVSTDRVIDTIAIADISTGTISTTATAKDISRITTSITTSSLAAATTAATTAATAAATAGGGAGISDHAIVHDDASDDVNKFREALSALRMDTHIGDDGWNNIIDDSLTPETLTNGGHQKTAESSSSSRSGSRAGSLLLKSKTPAPAGSSSSTRLKKYDESEDDDEDDEDDDHDDEDDDDIFETCCPCCYSGSHHSSWSSRKKGRRIFGADQYRLGSTNDDDDDDDDEYDSSDNEDYDAGDNSSSSGSGSSSSSEEQDSFHCELDKHEDGLTDREEESGISAAAAKRDDDSSCTGAASSSLTEERSYLNSSSAIISPSASVVNQFQIICSDDEDDDDDDDDDNKDKDENEDSKYPLDREESVGGGAAAKHHQSVVTTTTTNNNKPGRHGHQLQKLKDRRNSQHIDSNHHSSEDSGGEDDDLDKSAHGIPEEEGINDHIEDSRHRPPHHRWRNKILEMVRLKSRGGVGHGYHAVASEGSEHGGSLLDYVDLEAAANGTKHQNGIHSHITHDRHQHQHKKAAEQRIEQKLNRRRGRQGRKMRQQQQKPRRRLRHRNVLRQRIVVMITGNYGLLAMAYILLEETVPLFLKLDVDRGGFGFSSTEIGFLLSISGGVMLLFTSFILPVVAVYSKRRLFDIGIYGALPVTFAWPILALMNSSIIESWENESLKYWTLWLLLVLCAVMKSMLSCISFTAVMIMINNSVFDHHLGAANGLGQCLAALARAIGPAVGGALWSISVEHDFVWSNFIAVVASLLVCLIVNRYLPPELDFKKRAKKEKDRNHGTDKGSAKHIDAIHG